jgi:hypothetical protein
MSSELCVEWGKTTFADKSFKDGKVWSVSNENGNISEGIVGWNWIDDDTTHSSGVTAEAVDELLSHNPTTIIVTQGFDGRLNVPDDLVNSLSFRGYKVIRIRTAQAVAMFNYLVSQNENVVALIHSTC